jgi:signal peptidase II
MLELVLVALVIGADQLTKYVTDIYLVPLGTSVPLWKGVFQFTSAHNTGAAFGILEGGRWAFLIIGAVAIIAILVFLIKYRSRMHRLLRVCLTLILAGAIGNMIDRVALGYVRDMLDFTLINFAVFNVADSAVTIGAMMLIIDLFAGKSKQFFEEWDKRKHSCHMPPAKGPNDKTGDKSALPDTPPEKEGDAGVDAPGSALKKEPPCTDGAHDAV